MELIKPVFLFVSLFILTGLFCWLEYGLLLLSPLYCFASFMFGLLGIVMTLDLIQSSLFP
jgi:hypothetical protein